MENENLITNDMRKKAAGLLEACRKNHGLAPVDTERFWADNSISAKDVFDGNNPQMFLEIGMSTECVFDELGIKEDGKRFADDKERAKALVKAYNDKAEKIVGRRLLGESIADPAKQYPGVKTMADVFGARPGAWWIEKAADNESDLEKVLDNVEKRNRNLREFMFPANWESEKKRLLGLGVQPPWLHTIRGPVTFACAVYGVENLVYLITDNPPLAERFRNAIRDTALNMAEIMDKEAPGRTGTNWFNFYDDDCALLNAEMYEFFGYPVIRGIFDKYCPGEKDYRYQHSDSDMMHLLPILGKLNFSKVNFGPKCTVTQIREHCPKTIIQGQLAPFTFSRNEEGNMILETLRDFELSGGGIGMAFNTSGQINNGSMLAGMRLIMATIQAHCRRTA